MRILTLLFFILPSFVLCQKISVRSVTVQSSPHSVLVYPIVHYKDARTAQAINDAIEKEVFGEVDRTKKVQARIKDLGESMYSLDYSISYNDLYLLSFSIYIEACGAYCSSYTRYFNFDLNTGKSLSTDDLLLPALSNQFKKQLNERIIKSLAKEKSDALTRTRQNEDSATRNWVIEEFDECIRRVSTGNFAIHADKLEFVYDCSFPHAIRAFEPANTFSYSIAQVQEYMKPAYRKRIVKR
jgi:hypothetical protein